LEQEELERPTGLRTIVLHYHLFKNAGTSVDAILKQNFEEKWVTREFPPMSGNNTALVDDWIANTPEAIAYSSHTMTGPLPAPEGVRVIPVILLRDPIARIRSAYQFERRQTADTIGSRLAHERDFEGYVRGRLAIAGDRQCRDFHTGFLARMTPGPEDELTRAKASVSRLRQVGVVGLVAQFDEMMARLAEQLRPIWPDFDWQQTRTNTSDKADPVAVSDELLAELTQTNAMDAALLDWVQATI
jgi:hypothetical protein